MVNGRTGDPMVTALMQRRPDVVHATLPQLMVETNAVATEKKAFIAIRVTLQDVSIYASPVVV